MRNKKNKWLWAYCPLFVVTTFLSIIWVYQSHKSSSKPLSVNKNEVSDSVEDEHLSKQLTKPVVKPEINSINKSNGLNVKAKFAQPTKISNEADLNVDFIVDLLGDDLVKRLGKHAFEREIEELAEYPKSVIIEFKPKLGSITRYERFSKRCDENGTPFEDAMELTASKGILKREVIAVDEEKNTFTIKESVEGEILTAKPNFEMFSRKLLNTSPVIFTYAKDGSLLKAERQGHDVTSSRKRVPRLVFPQKELHTGDSWTCKGEIDTPRAWEINARISGFARVAGHDCVIVSFEEIQQVSMPQIRTRTVKRVGKKYYDLQTMDLVRRERVETTAEEFGINEKNYLGVMELLSK